MGIVIIGIDVGQKVDPTAIAVVEQEYRAGLDHFTARYLDRLPLGTPYPEIAERLAAIIGSVRKRAKDEAEVAAERRMDTEYMTQREESELRRDAAGAGALISVYIDSTGVGQPVVDLLSRSAGMKINPVYFTHGDRRTEEKGEQGDPYDVKVLLGKAWLVSRLQVLLQQKRIHLPDTKESKALAKELQDYEIKVDQNANDTYGAFKVGTHDDLVTALGLAVQKTYIPPCPTMTGNYLGERIVRRAGAEHGHGYGSRGKPGRLSGW